MSQRHSSLLWLRDLLEHLTTTQQQLQMTNDNDAIRVLTESMLRDLDSCRRQCEALRRRAGVRQAI
jgi:hypothetical protein